jgi:hypothetical protein
MKTKTAACSCGAVKGQHSLRESGRCDWLKRPLKVRQQLVAEGNSKVDVQGNPLAPRRGAAVQQVAA